jgi:hypothetical protein
MLYKNEFGTDFDLGFNLKDYPYLIDKSWHNDVSPSFYFNVGSLYYVLWVDYSNPAKREESNNRYLIQEAINDGDDINPEIYSSNGIVIFESEHFMELEVFLPYLLAKSSNVITS